MMRNFVFFIIVSSLFFLQACSSSGFESDGNDLGFCEEQYDCPEEQLCVFSICSSTDDLNNMQISVQLPAESGLLSQQFFNLKADSNIPLKLKLKGSRQFKSKILGSDGQPIAASIKLYPKTFIQGRQLQLTTQNDENGKFSLKLLELEEYRLRIIPLSGSLPPFTTHINSDDKLPASYKFDNLANYRNIFGKVVINQENGNKIEDLSNLKITILGDSRLISTIALTDAQGLFTLHIANTPVQKYEIKVSNTEDSSTLPQITLDISSQIDNGNSLQALELQNINLGEWEKELMFHGQLLHKDNSPIQNAQIYLRSSGNNHAVIEQKIYSDRNGNFETNIARGVYDIAILPSLSDKQASLYQIKNYNIDSQNNEVNWQLSAKSSQKLSLLAPNKDNSSIIGAKVEMTRRFSDTVFEDTTIMQTLSWSYEAVSNKSGEVLLTLDAGLYRVRITPPDSYNMPSSIFLFNIYEGSFDESINLFSGKSLAGTCFAPNGELINPARVEIYSSIIDENDQAVMMADGLIDTNNNFSSIIPNLDYNDDHSLSNY